MNLFHCVQQSILSCQPSSILQPCQEFPKMVVAVTAISVDCTEAFTNLFSKPLLRFVSFYKYSFYTVEFHITVIYLYIITQRYSIYCEINYNFAINIAESAIFCIKQLIWIFWGLISDKLHIAKSNNISSCHSPTLSKQYLLKLSILVSVITST